MTRKGKKTTDNDTDTELEKSITNDAILKYIVSNDIIDLPSIEGSLIMAERKKYLEMHTYSVWLSKSGKWCTYLPDEKRKYNRMLYKRNTKEEIENLIIDYWKGQENNPTIEEVFKEYNEHRLELKKVQKSTILRDTKRFERYYSEFKKRKIKSVTPMDIEDFLEEQIPKYNLTASEFSNLKGITRGFLRRAKKRGLINFNVVQLLQELDVSDHQFKQVVIDDEKEVYFDDEMQEVIEYAHKRPISVNLGIALMFVTGVRVGELACLKRDDFDGLTFKVKRTETRWKDAEGNWHWDVKEFPKTRAGYRTVIVPRSYGWILEEIEKINPTSEFMFTDKFGNRMRTFSFRRQLYRLDDRFNIPHKSPHKIRKTYCSILLDNKVDNNLIEKQVGHVDISLTEGRYHRDRKSLEKKIAVISSIPELSYNAG